MRVPRLKVKVIICKDTSTTFQSPMLHSAPERWVREGRSEANETVSRRVGVSRSYLWGHGGDPGPRDTIGDPLVERS
jgi:hypothetical protein